MSVIPAGTVSKSSPVDIRLAVKNRAAFTKNYKIDFFVDYYSSPYSINGASTPILLTIAAGAEDLARYVWDPLYFTGDHTILYRVKEVQGGTDVVVGSGEWPLTIVDTTDSAPSTFTAAWVEPGELVENGNSPDVQPIVISQVYTGGGLAGATWRNDFVELFNKGDETVSFTNWSIQEVSATGSDTFSTNTISTINGSIDPGQYFLVKLGSSGAGGTLLPTADATGTNNLPTTDGTVALVRQNSSSAVSTDLDITGREDGRQWSYSTKQTYAGKKARIEDLVGYGSRASTTTAPWISHTAETTPAPGTSATTALIRDDAGCMDRGFNSEDFTAGSPAPRNTSSTFRAECELFLEADLRDSIDEMADLGIDTIIVAYPEGEWLGWGSFYPDTVGYLDYDDRALQWIDDPIGVILEQADANGMHVYMGTGRGTCDSSMTAEQCAIGGPLPCLNGLMPTDAMYDHALSQSMSTAQDLWAQYGDLDSFYGWFISHESQLYYKDQPSDDHSCGEFFNELAADLHDEFGAEMPVMVAPSGYLPDLDATYIATSNVDVFAYQDAMGCNFDPVTDTLTGTSIPFVKCRWHPAYADAANWGSPPFPANGYSRLDHISDVYDDYAAIHAAAAGLGPFKHLWDDLEVWRKPGPDYASASFAGPCSEVSDQMAAVSDSVEQFTMYAYLGYMQSAASKLNPRPGGRELYDEYEDFATGVTGSFCP